jgi:hypothetical protein
MLTFDNNETGYLQWVADNPNGFVINAPKRSGDFPDYLHRASCGSIRSKRRTNYTTTTFKKICSVDRQELVDWGATHSSDFREVNSAIGPEERGKLNRRPGVSCPPRQAPPKPPARQTT